MKPKQSRKLDNIIATFDALIAAREQKEMDRKKLREAQNPSFFLSCWYHIKDFFTLD